MSPITVSWPTVTTYGGGNRLTAEERGRVRYNFRDYFAGTLTNTIDGLTATSVTIYTEPAYGQSYRAEVTATLPNSEYIDDTEEDTIRINRMAIGFLSLELEPTNSTDTQATVDITEHVKDEDASDVRITSLSVLPNTADISASKIESDATTVKIKGPLTEGNAIILMDLVDELGLEGNFTLSIKVGSPRVFEWTDSKINEYVVADSSHYVTELGQYLTVEDDINVAEDVEFRLSNLTQQHSITVFPTTTTVPCIRTIQRFPEDENVFLSIVLTGDGKFDVEEFYFMTIGASGAYGSDEVRLVLEAYSPTVWSSGQFVISLIRGSVEHEVDLVELLSQVGRVRGSRSPRQLEFRFDDGSTTAESGSVKANLGQGKLLLESVRGFGSQQNKYEFTVSAGFPDYPKNEADFIFNVFDDSDNPEWSATSYDIGFTTFGEIVNVSLSDKITDADHTFSELSFVTSNSAATIVGTGANRRLRIDTEAFRNLLIRTFLVTASDPDGNTDATTFTLVQRTDDDNNAPVWKATNSFTYEVGDTNTINLNNLVDDPDGDSITFTTTLPSTTLATISKSSNDSRVTITGRRAGSFTFTSVAKDDGEPSLETSQTFTINIVDELENNAPIWVNIPRQRVLIGQTIELDLSLYCSDPDLDPLTFGIDRVIASRYTAVLADDGVTLRITGVAVTSDSTCRVSASDGIETVLKSFFVRVSRI